MNKQTPTLKIKDIVLLKQYPEEYFKKHYNVERKSYSHKPHLAKLPYDLNTNDVDKLKERLDACNEGLKESQEKLEQLQNLKKDIENVEQYRDEIKEESKKQLERIKQKWESVQYDDYYSEDIEEFVEEYMDDFINDMENNEGFITQTDANIHSTLVEELDYAIPSYADDESGYPSWGRLHGFENFVEDHDRLERYIREYLNDFNIDGNSDYAKEMKARLDKLPNDWEEQNKTLNREIGKAETRVNDYKEHGRKIRDKMNKLGTDSRLVEIPDGRIVDLDEGTGFGDLTVEDILFDPYDFEPMDYD